MFELIHARNAADRLSFNRDLNPLESSVVIKRLLRFKAYRSSVRGCKSHCELLRRARATSFATTFTTEPPLILGQSLPITVLDSHLLVEGDEAALQPKRLYFLGFLADNHALQDTLSGGTS